MTGSNIEDIDGTYDATFADLRVSNDVATVDYEAIADKDGTVRIRRSVTRKARYAQHRVCLWQDDAVIIDSSDAFDLLRDLTSAFGEACSHEGFNEAKETFTA